MITELKNGKIIITLETEREIQLVKCALGSVTHDVLASELADAGYKNLQEGEPNASIILFSRLSQLTD